MSDRSFLVIKGTSPYLISVTGLSVRQYPSPAEPVFGNVAPPVAIMTFLAIISLFITKLFSFLISETL